MSTPILACRLGRVAYEPAFALQQLVAELRAEGKLPDTLLLLEHEPVYTLGRRGSESEILFDAGHRKMLGIDLVRTDRGGLVTYHGPGQVVGYPIFDLGPAPDVLSYVCKLEKAMIFAAERFGAGAQRVEGLPGIWVGQEKLGAVGVHVSRGITTHGFALNVSPDLAAYNGIVPCGIADKGVTSLTALTGSEIEIDDVMDALADAFAEQFGRPVSSGVMDLEGRLRV